MRRRGESISFAEGDGVPGGSVRHGSVSKNRSDSRGWRRRKSSSRSRSPSVENIENPYHPYARPNRSNHRSLPDADANANARATSPDRVY